MVSGFSHFCVLGIWACLAVMASLRAGKRAVMKHRLVKAKTATQVARLLDAMRPLRNDKEFNLAISAHTVRTVWGT